jgi:hypothetical protein
MFMANLFLLPFSRADLTNNLRFVRLGITYLEPLGSASGLLRPELLR